ncbi:uncharacterized protein LOC100623157 isoform X3 [Sus scrofa]|uniref:uncharacterized protein LOC100623157 isoform X3 n=1 Tax=Sus scrofa TaxID=9823 RepID=UPI000A2B3F82|nr:uncharacterized protein LOC100623157 isoform X3 [Sus scrofa]XP_020949967.1 uncharacterized protein LOC100623157 isoform X3 [Sus scrofa]
MLLLNGSGSSQFRYMIFQLPVLPRLLYMGALGLKHHHKPLGSVLPAAEEKESLKARRPRASKTETKSKGVIMEDEHTAGGQFSKKEKKSLLKFSNLIFHLPEHMVPGASLMEHSPREMDALSVCWQHPATRPAGDLAASSGVIQSLVESWEACSSSNSYCYKPKEITLSGALLGYDPEA